ncbi:hypothetical protein UVI_02051490 [Ustilaginoidea virens]|uniref:Uncharacterized protein n=1 Tax=Ustilaginoidea virens TaxID=1159556 RepID=A0A1B5KXT8_USTVR|nr:hypothetical protein UVI_02051490 [Ustilaginoidea virens]
MNSLAIAIAALAASVSALPLLAQEVSVGGGSSCLVRCLDTPPAECPAGYDLPVKAAPVFARDSEDDEDIFARSEHLQARQSADDGSSDGTVDGGDQGSASDGSAAPASGAAAPVPSTVAPPSGSDGSGDSSSKSLGSGSDNSGGSSGGSYDGSSGGTSGGSGSGYDSSSGGSGSGYDSSSGGSGSGYDSSSGGSGSGSSIASSVIDGISGTLPMMMMGGLGGIGLSGGRGSSLKNKIIPTNVRAAASRVRNLARPTGVRAGSGVANLLPSKLAAHLKPTAGSKIGALKNKVSGTIKAPVAKANTVAKSAAQSVKGAETKAKTMVNKVSGAVKAPVTKANTATKNTVQSVKNVQDKAKSAAQSVTAPVKKLSSIAGKLTGNSASTGKVNPLITSSNVNPSKLSVISNKLGSSNKAPAKQASQPAAKKALKIASTSLKVASKIGGKRRGRRSVVEREPETYFDEFDNEE